MVGFPLGNIVPRGFLLVFFIILFYNIYAMRKGGEMEEQKQIINIREITGLNRKEFAERFDIPYRTISDWELGNRKPPEYLLKLLRYCVLTEKIQGKKQEKQDRNINVIEDLRGNKIVVIDDIIFHNKQNIKWKDVEQYLQRYVGDFYIIASDQQKIYIGKDLPDEYAHSKYTAGLKGATAKSKANAVQVLPELIEMSENRTYIENHEKKHNKDAKYGWYRYDARFAIAIYDRSGEIERYNIFKVRMIIRHDEDGKKYLYDMINIKKESEYPA